jgi:hypothetical protein
VTAVAGSLIARLRQAGATLTCLPDGRVRFAAPMPVPADLLTEARRHRDAIARLLGAPSDLGALPAAPCPDCGSSLWWRVSVLSGGPGAWHCERCQPPDPDVWRDACACPVTEVRK